MFDLTGEVGQTLLKMRESPSARKTAALVALFFLVASFTLALVTRQGHFFSISFVTITLAGWFGGWRLGLLVGVLVPLTSAPVAYAAHVPLDAVARDTFGFMFIGVLCGGAIGLLSTLLGYVVSAQRELKLLYDILPICCYCKKIQHEDEGWQPLEVFFHKHSETKLSHGICPDCMREHAPEAMRMRDSEAP